MNLKKIKKVHFIGIGGIGVSAVARMMLGENKIVSGSNLGKSQITKELEKIGATIFDEHNEDNLKEDVDIVIYSPAIPEDNSELQKATKLNIPCFSYPQILGLISKNKYTIAISGTHGKTTTTAMISNILQNSNLDPTVIVGSLMKNRAKQKTNFIKGKSKYFVVEACEYKRSFLQLQPNILIITNIDIDHLDYYKDLTDIQSAFRELVLKMNESDFVICDSQNKNIIPVIKNIKAKIINVKNKNKRGLNLKLPGEYNVENALNGLALSKILNLDKKKTLEALNNFEGTWRRFEYKGKTKNGVLVYDDYAHNPTEIKAVLKGAKNFFKNKKIIVIFQPHLYSRTKILFNNFTRSFKKADSVIILPIYAAREKQDLTINSKMLAKKISNAVFSEYKDINLNKFTKNDVVITMGAGDVYKIGEKFLC